MEENGMDKLEDMASVRDFDPLTGSIPATKVEITVSCRFDMGDEEDCEMAIPLQVIWSRSLVLLVDMIISFSPVLKWGNLQPPGPSSITSLHTSLLPEMG
ncbi:hypothetical protein JRQ81_015075 [Phrynocephalus forsythii]|uniref:Uncharacterized protein n=1 Tax=Phrynocephalus forsythii TaxID=171643 RepID=A0A9Q1B445_9SAUR|nr:hypothetical protein JRQ81_015075 [Phrynocephalus forsythii]